MSLNKATIEDIISKKGKEKITMLTCYDSSFASIVDKTGVDILLVGDSLANVVLGLENTKEVSIREMINHTRAVVREAKKALVVADMPYKSYQINKSKALYYAKKFIEEAGADAVKIEWFKHCKDTTALLVKNNIPVMGHIGLTPQTADKLGGFRVQGKDAKKAAALLEEAKILSELGVFSIVIECVPTKVSQLITESIAIPTIGIGAGSACDGQVLVLYDLLGLYSRLTPKFVRKYIDLAPLIDRAVKDFIDDVKEGRFPSSRESFSIKDEEMESLLSLLKRNPQ